MIFLKTTDNLIMAKETEKETERGAEIVKRIENELRSKGMKKGAFYRYAGITSQSLRNWKLQNSIPGTDTTIKMAEYLRVSVKWLITGIDDIDITNKEREFIVFFKQLDQDDKDEIIEIIHLKLKKRELGDTLSSSVNA